MCVEIELEHLCKSYRTDINEKSQILDMLGFAFDFDSDAILLGYSKYA